MTPETTGATLLVECLRANGVRQAFGVPGESYLAVLDALYEVRDEIDFLTCRQEGGAAYMAEAWGKLTGEPGICFVTRGPGATNAAIGVHTAMQDSSPMILFVGQVGRTERGREAFQEVDYRAFFSPLCKWATEIDDPARVPEIVSRAFATARSGRPGPVVVALPEDMLVEATTAKPCAARVTRAAVASASTVNDIAEILQAASKPLLLAGGGGWSHDSKAALQAFAEKNDLPVLAAFRFNDLIDNHSHCYVGDAGVAMTAATRDLIAQADVILALGARLGEVTTAVYSLLECPVPRQTLIHVMADSAELGKVYQADLAVNACPGMLLEALLACDLKSQQRHSGWCDNARRGWQDSLQAPAQPGAVDMGNIMQWLRERLPGDAIITNGAGNFTVWPNKYFSYGQHARLLAPQSGAMGYGIPAAVAAKACFPERVVVCFAGDGDFQMTMQELGSALQAGKQPIVLLLNNAMYGTIRMHQERNYPARISGTDIVNPNFVQLAKAYGYHAEQVSMTADFAAAFERALASAVGAVLEILIDPEILTPQQTVTQARQVAYGADDAS